VPVGEKERPSVEKVGEWYVKNRHLQGYSPHLCWLRTDGLAPTSKYWTYRSHIGVMGLVSLVAGCQQKLIFSPLSHWLLWERSWIRTHGSDDRRAVDCVGSPSSWRQWICRNLLTTSRKVVMRWPCEIRMVDGHTWTEHGKRVAYWSCFPLQGVYRFKSPRLSDLSITCLWQSSRS
jgi:hypothetical protein